MNTVCLFGATGNTGSIVLRMLIQKGFPVKALVRDPAKVRISDSFLSVIQGNILDESSVLRALEHCDAVINVIGHVKGCPADLQTQATRYILQGMKLYGISRLIDLTGGGVKVTGDNPDLLDRTTSFIMKNLAGDAFRNRFTDGENHVKLIEQSGLDWTIVRAPVLLPGPAKGKTKIGMVGHIPGYSLKFEDLAAQIVKMLEDKSYIRQYPYITNG